MHLFRLSISHDFVFIVNVLVKLPNLDQQKNMSLFPSLHSQPKQHHYHIALPRINFHKTRTDRPPHHQQALKFTPQEITEEMIKLEQFASNMNPAAKRKRNATSQSILFLYKPIKQSIKTKASHLAQLSGVSLYLTQLDGELAKIKKINYQAIYLNVEYCSGLFEIAFSDIEKKIDGYKKMLESTLQSKIKAVDEMRNKRIQEILLNRRETNQTNSRIFQAQIHQIHSRVQVSEKNEDSQASEKEIQSLAVSSIQNSEVSIMKQSDLINKSMVSRFATGVSKHKNVHKLISLCKTNNKPEITIQMIEKKQKQLEPIKKLLVKIDQARLKLLYFSLELGYDVRNQGLVWLLREIGQIHRIQYSNNDEEKENNTTQKQKSIIPDLSQFPSFLTEQEINFIISKYKNDFKLKIIQEQKQLKDSQQKQMLQNTYQDIRRGKNRKLSMIKQKQILQKILKQRQTERISGHKYLSSDTIKMIKESQKVKSTRNQLIYQQTLRKLSKFCVQEIYSKKQRNKNGSINEQSQQMNVTIQKVKQMLSNSIVLQKQEQKIKTEEQKELSDILMKLRNEIYEGRSCSQKRNPISVICCLVGWKKAKKILEYEMNISMPSQ